MNTGNGVEDLCDHLNSHKYEREHRSWVDRYIGRGKEASPDAIERIYGTSDIKKWIVDRLIERIYGEPVHPFILRLQHPDNSVIYGYVMEHHHFLRQWVRSCSAVISKTEEEDVQLYEIDNIVSEFMGMGPDRPSHHELLLRMGESIGVSREKVYSTPPLSGTAYCIGEWRKIAEQCHWVEIMAAMHTLELTANPEIKKMGARLTYFDPSILTDNAYPEAVRNFLHEGYMADQTHSMEALELVEKYCGGREMERNVQSAVMKSISLLDTYLMSRLERGKEYEGKQQERMRAV